MKRTFIYFILIVIVFSCKKNNERDFSHEPEENTENRSSQHEAEKTDPQVIERDELVANWAKELEKISRDERFKMEKELVENSHMRDVIDTIKTFSYRNTSLRVYHTEGLYAVESAEINDPEFSLKGPVQIGMEKNQLQEILDSKLDKQLVKVNNEVGTFEFNFYFKNNILQRIYFQGYVD